MKVSRKVGRRKRASSYSISRRRLRNKKSRSGYRKKNAKTQKGGKRGRGQKRMRARTHKRGKRFHRGGLNEDGTGLNKCTDGGTPDKPGNVIDLNSGIFPTPEFSDDDIANYTGVYKKCFSMMSSYDYSGVDVLEFSNVNLVYTKNTGALGGFFNASEASNPFKVVIIRAKNALVKFNVILTRTGKDDKIGEYDIFAPYSSLEVFFILSGTDLDGIKKELTYSSKLKIMKSNQHYKDSMSHTYNFNFDKNTRYFEYFKRAAEYLENYAVRPDAETR
jgi:hypothetical protein